MDRLNQPSPGQRPHHPSNGCIIRLDQPMAPRQPAVQRRRGGRIRLNQPNGTTSGAALTARLNQPNGTDAGPRPAPALVMPPVVLQNTLLVVVGPPTVNFTLTGISNSGTVRLHHAFGTSARPQSGRIGWTIERRIGWTQTNDLNATVHKKVRKKIRKRPVQQGRQRRSCCKTILWYGLDFKEPQGDALEHVATAVL